MGEIGEKLQLTHLKRDSFLRLLDFLTTSLPPRRVVTAAPMCNPPVHEHLELYPHPVFDLPLSGVKMMTFCDPAGQCRTERFLPGDVFQLPPATWKLPRWTHAHEMACLVLQKNFIRITYVDITAPTGTRPLCNTFFHTAQPPSKEIRQLAELLARIGLDDDHAGVTPDLFRALLHLVRHALVNDCAPEIPKARMTFLKIRNYLLENFTAELSREEVARKFHLNSSYLSRLFHEQEGCSFSAFLIRLRLERAAMLLRETDLLVDEIADSCGYRSTTFFSAAFKHVYGIPPGRYRCECSRRNPSRQADRTTE